MAPSETPSLYSLNPSLHYYSQGAPSAPGLYQPYSYYGYPPPQMSPWGYASGPNPHHTAASSSQNTNNLVDTASLQFRNTFAPPKIPSIPSRAPLAPLSLSQPSATSSTSRKRASQAGGPAPKRARRSDSENAEPGASTSNANIPITATGPFIPPIRAATYQHPAFTAFTSILPKDRKNTKVASDVWFFMKSSQTKQRPDIILPTLPDESLFFERPKDTAVHPYLACRLCT